MKTIRNLILIAISLASLIAPQTVRAQSNPPAAVVVVPRNNQSVYPDLKSAPPQIQALITSFDATRDKYLAAQNLLLIKLKNATTAEEREKIRERLQDNRMAFLSAVSSFRESLKTQLTALKSKISHEEFLRIIDAAHDAATEGGLNHHKGH